MYGLETQIICRKPLRGMVSQTIALSLSLLTAVVTPVSLRDHLA